MKHLLILALLSWLGDCMVPRNIHYHEEIPQGTSDSLIQGDMNGESDELSGNAELNGHNTLDAVETKVGEQSSEEGDGADERGGYGDQWHRPRGGYGDVSMYQPYNPWDHYDEMGRYPRYRMDYPYPRSEYGMGHPYGDQWHRPRGGDGDVSMYQPYNPWDHYDEMGRYPRYRMDYPYPRSVYGMDPQYIRYPNYPIGFLPRQRISGLSMGSPYKKDSSYSMGTPYMKGPRSHPNIMRNQPRRPMDHHMVPEANGV